MDDRKIEIYSFYIFSDGNVIKFIKKKKKQEERYSKYILCIHLYILYKLRQLNKLSCISEKAFFVKSFLIIKEFFAICDHKSQEVSALFFICGCGWGCRSTTVQLSAPVHVCGVECMCSVSATRLSVVANFATSVPRLLRPVIAVRCLIIIFFA